MGFDGVAAARTVPSLMDKKKQDVQDVLKEEGRRGRRPTDLQGQRAYREQLAKMRRLLEISTEQEFVNAMLAYGMVEGSEEFLVSLQTWREYRP
jgi:hypothetical protein